MFLGEFSHSLDRKGRVILPARFREQLAQAVLTCQVDSCLALWTPSDFEAHAERMKEKERGDLSERNAARVFFAGACEVTPDAVGRVAIPANLRAYANLGETVKLTGARDHVDIWDAATWTEIWGSGAQELHAPRTNSPPTYSPRTNAPTQ